MKACWIIFLFLFLFISIQCTNDQEKYDVKSHGFHLFVDANMEQQLYNSRRQRIILPENRILYFDNNLIKTNEISSRGRNSLNYRRKSFSINVAGKANICNKFLADTFSVKEFKLLSMSMDNSYIENKISYQILSRIGLWQLRSFYTELYINNSNQGMYLYVDDPQEYLYKELDAKFILRRRYDHKVGEVYYKNKNSVESKLFRGYNHYISTKMGAPKIKLKSDYYVGRFNLMYDFLRKYKGKQLYDSIAAVVNLEDYLKKMAIDNVLQNGDYTDEIFFYSKSKPGGKIYFDILPWDYDDIFSKVPHEIAQKDTYCGKMFGIRTYPTYHDYEIATNGRLVFSIEDDLDYTIMKDDYLYQRYLECFRGTLLQLDTLFIDEVFTQTHLQLRPFFNDKEVVEQSKFDENETSIELLETNIKEKRKALTERIKFFNLKLDSLGVKAFGK